MAGALPEDGNLNIKMPYMERLGSPKERKEAAQGGAAAEAGGGVEGTGGGGSRRKRGRFNPPDREKFACQLSVTAANRNKHLTGPLEELYSYLQAKVNTKSASGPGAVLSDLQWNARNLQKLIGLLKMYTKKVDSQHGLKKFFKKNKGSYPEDKVPIAWLNELVSRGPKGLSILGICRSDPQLQLMIKFMGIPWVGFASAENLIKSGYTSIADLRERGQHVLSPRQRTGLKRYEDLQEKMPRSEAAQLYEVVRQAAEALCPGVRSVVCGSYRRGKATCGDIDILFAPPKGREHCDLLHALTRVLSERGFLTDHLQLPGPHVEDMADVYMGICKLDKGSADGSVRPKYRRIDMKVYPAKDFASAVLYFTGSAHFNRSMRRFAGLSKLTLSDKGLFHARRGANYELLGKGKRIECYTEESIFEALNLVYKPPHERNVYDVYDGEGPSSLDA